MKRFAGLLFAWGLVVFVLTPIASARYQVVSVSPGSGEAGTMTTVIGSGFTPDGIPIEVRAGGPTGALLGTGTSSSGGIFGIQITIPAGISPGPFTIYACGSCNSEFHPEATTTFQVTEPPPEEPPPEEPPPEEPPPEEPPPEEPPPEEPPPEEPPPEDPEEPEEPAEEPEPEPEVPATEPDDEAPGEPCEFPDDAVIMGFDAWNLTFGDTTEFSGPLQQALLEQGHPFYLHQWDTYEIRFDPPDDDHLNVLVPPRVDSIGFVTDDPAGDLWTSSEPMVMRRVADTHWTMFSGWGNLPGQLDYLGFTVGFGHFPEGFEVLDGQDDVADREDWDGFATADEVVVELRVSTMPMVLDDGAVLDQADWDPVSVTLGPGPQPVAYCLIAENTVGELDPKTVYLVDVVVESSDGEPLAVPVDVDDVFYGYDGSEFQLPPPAILDEGSGTNWLLWIALLLALLIVLLGIYLATRRDEEDEPPPPPDPA